MKIMEFDLKWVHMARYELILKLDGALWWTRPDPKIANENKKMQTGSEVRFESADPAVRYGSPFHA